MIDAISSERREPRSTGEMSHYNGRGLGLPLRFFLRFLFARDMIFVASRIALHVVVSFAVHALPRTREATAEKAREETHTGDGGGGGSDRL